MTILSHRLLNVCQVILLIGLSILGMVSAALILGLSLILGGSLFILLSPDLALRFILQVIHYALSTT